MGPVQHELGVHAHHAGVDQPGPGESPRLVDDLLDQDELLVLPDYRSDIDAQGHVDAAWADRDGWARRSILNTARCGFFSSDRAIDDYLRQILACRPVPASGAPRARA